MSKTYAAIYIPKDPVVDAPPAKVEGIDAVKNDLDKNAQDIKISTDNFCFNLSLVKCTAFTQRYAMGALTEIINGRPITNQTMLDSLFNTYAPALNLAAAQMGYNSLMEMRTAVSGANINPSNFLQGFSNGLETVLSLNAEDDDFKYGEEIPIDVVEHIKITYNSNVAQKTSDNKDNDNVDNAPKEQSQKSKSANASQYQNSLQNCTIEVTGHIANENLEIWSMCDFVTKIVDAQTNSKKVCLRLGKTIYDGCIIVKNEVNVDNIYDTSFILMLSYKNTLQNPTRSTSEKKYKLVVRNDRNGLLGKMYVKAQKEVYGGIVSYLGE